MAKRIDVAEAARRLEDAGLNFADRYAAGVEGAGGDWFSGASKAGKNYEQGIQTALQQDRFQKGVQEAGASAYDEGIRNKGIQNWPTGMQTAGAKYQRKVQPFTALWDQALPTARGPKRSPQNLKRMNENVERFARVAGR